MGPATPARTLPGRRFDPAKAARWLRRLALPLLVLALAALYLTLEMVRVPAGMDSMPDIPPGSTCLLDKRSGSAHPGVAVFVDLPGGGSLLTRLVAREPDGTLLVRNDNAASALPDSDDFGLLPAAALRGTVLVVFPPDVAPEVPK